MWAPAPWILEIPILKRLIPSVLRRYASLAKHPYVVERRMGALFLIDQGNLVDKMLLTRGNWEHTQIATLRRLIDLARRDRPQQRRMFLDIGAHGALYSILLAKEPGFDAIHAFEPEPENFAQLQGNLFINGLAGIVTAHQAAVSMERGWMTIIGGSRGNRGAATAIAVGSDAAQESGRRVASVAIDDLFQCKGDLVVAKIDVESHELDVIAGMAELLAANDAVLQIECFEPNRRALRAVLGKLGYAEVAAVAEDLYFTRSAPRPI